MLALHVDGEPLNIIPRTASHISPIPIPLLCAAEDFRPRDPEAWDYRVVDSCRRGCVMMTTEGESREPWLGQEKWLLVLNLSSAFLSTSSLIHERLALNVSD